ncbi:mitochondrial small ribosomal subunit Rsm22-domain-containing protein [Usnea florida]
MQLALTRQRLCYSCHFQLLSIFADGTTSTARLPRQVPKLSSQHRFRHSFRAVRRPQSSVTQDKRDAASDNELRKTRAQMEMLVREARETFGDTLPEDFLSSEEYAIYERLYGPPSAITQRSDELKALEEEGEEMGKGVLIRVNDQGEPEEVPYHEGPAEFIDEDPEPTPSKAEKADLEHRPRMEQMALLREIADANLPQAEEDVAQESGDSRRTHPLTLAGRFGTSPATIQIRKDTVVDPITLVLADASNKQLSEVARKVFGGDGLPNSTATIIRPHLRQQPIALEASQYNMGEMESNAYLAAIMPGAYAIVMSILVEIRKRLGSEWIRKLIEKEGGPRVLDAGAGGAGVFAWREILRAEWKIMHPDGLPPNKPPPYGKSTVVTGSSALRHRASRLLDDTTFIPRLPDYDPSRDHPSLENNNPQPRKQYDVIIAPYTLWTLKEDYMRKNQVQNFWSLLDPKGGVLVLIEKGIPRGFELIAGARETLLKHHVSSPGDEKLEAPIDDASQNRFGPKEKGMIIAPCTNHGKCPMYITAGRSQGRKDYCHFSQRYLRPHFLQRILRSRDKNHEDISFSYVALQRGVDQREADNVMQGEGATEAAFSGFEDPKETESTKESQAAMDSRIASVNPLSLPRAILPPIKSKGHVTLDLCTPAGRIERWTVPKSFSKQAYRDARKSKWGDLWALGAKTRVPRNIRVGLKKSDTQEKELSDTSEEAGEMTDDIGDVQAPKYVAVEGKKRTKKAKRKMVEIN